jgi:hypothetical protein
MLSNREGDRFLESIAQVLPQADAERWPWAIATKVNAISQHIPAAAQSTTFASLG